MSIVVSGVKIMISMMMCVVLVCDSLCMVVIKV